MTLPAHVAPDLVIDFNVYDEAFIDNLSAGTQGLPPVGYTVANEGHWVVSGFELITNILRESDTFATWPASIPSAFGAGRGRFVPLEYDPPEHTAYRQILLPHFSPPRIRDLEGMVRDLVAELLDDIAALGACDFMESFGRPFPARMFLGLMSR